jgi:hypothetical protein
MDSGFHPDIGMDGIVELISDMAVPEIVKSSETHTYLWVSRVTPPTDPQTHPTTAEIGLFGPLLLSGHTPSWSRL